MNAAWSLGEADRVAETLRLTREIEALIPRTSNGRKALALLAIQENSLDALRRRLLEAALVELLWQYQDDVEGTDTGYVVRQLLADIGMQQ